MEAFVLVPALLLLPLALWGCRQLFRLLDYRRTSWRVLGWLLIVPCMLLTLFLLLEVVTLFHPEPRQQELVPAAAHAR